MSEHTGALEAELIQLNYEKSRLENAFEAMKKKIETRVPVIAEVEKRRIELEYDALDKQKEYKNL